MFCLNNSASFVMRELCLAARPISKNRSHGHGLQTTMDLSALG